MMKINILIHVRNSSAFMLLKVLLLADCPLIINFMNNLYIDTN